MGALRSGSDSLVVPRRWGSPSAPLAYSPFSVRSFAAVHFSLAAKPAQSAVALPSLSPYHITILRLPLGRFGQFVSSSSFNCSFPKKNVVWEARAPERKRGKHDYQPAGLAILAPKLWKTCLKQLRISTGAHTGRAMMCWFHTTGISLALVNVYCYVQTHLWDCAGANTEIWNQVLLWLQDLPQHTMIVVCTDSNGHNGSVRERDHTAILGTDLDTLNTHSRLK